MKRLDWIIGVGVGLAVCVLYLLSYGLPVRGSNAGGGTTPTPTASFAAGAEGTPAAPPAGPPLAERVPLTGLPSGEVRLHGVSVIYASNRSGGDGTLHVHSGKERLAPVPIVDGFGSIPDTWTSSPLPAAPAPADFLFVPLAGVPVIPVASDLVTIDGNLLLVVAVSPPVSMRVQAVDLRGSAIVGARVSVGLPAVVPSIGEAIVTDESGQARLSVFGLGQTARIRVEAAGYSYSTTSVLLEQEIVSIVMKLGRILAAGHVLDRRYPGISVDGTIPANAGNAPRAIDWQPVLAFREVGWGLSEYDIVDWTAVQERSEWLENPELHFVVHDYYAGSVKPFVIPMKHVLDPDLAPIRVPMDDTPYAGPLRCVLGPPGAFLAAPPDVVYLRFIPLHGEEHPRNRWRPTADGSRPFPGYRLEGTTYEFWVPPGQYRVESNRSPSDDLLAEYPSIVPLASVWVGEGTLAQVHPLELEEGVAYIGYHFVNEHGMTVDFPGILVSNLESRGMVFPCCGLTPRYRFMKPGTYSLVGMNSLTGEPERIREDVRWPDAVHEGGLLPVLVPGTSDPQFASTYQ